MTSRSVTFWLPTPPSTNALFIVRGRKRIVSPKYSAWRDKATLLVWSAIGPRPGYPFINGSVELHYEVAENGRRDLDNYTKPLCDILVEGGAIESDRCACVRKITLEWSHDLDDGVRVTITPAAPWVKRRGAAKK
jgi:Holliday junction resolvase RusA-like endonuclease